MPLRRLKLVGQKKLEHLGPIMGASSIADAILDLTQWLKKKEELRSGGRKGSLKLNI